MRILNLVFIGLSFFINHQALAQKAAKTPKAAVSQPVAKDENLLDFEAEVIEGEKKRPDMFLEISAYDGRMGSGLYLRNDFNDFFSIDRTQRNRFVRLK